MIERYIFELAAFLTLLTIGSLILGEYIAKIFKKERTILYSVCEPLSRFLVRAAGKNAEREMNWREYATAFFLFNLLGIFVVYLFQRFQGVLPLNPAGMGAVSADSSFNTAISFASNTNWQGYGGESTMSYLTQQLGLNVQNFLSAAAGIAVLFALIRGFIRAEARTIGNFWDDLIRSTVYLLLPLSILLAVALVSQGVVQTYAEYSKAKTVEALTDASGNSVVEQVIAVGPAASQIAIKQLGTNGGGFFNTNSTHPLENPTPLSNLLEVLAILLIPGALCFTFGRLVGRMSEGWMLYGAMTVVFVIFLTLCFAFEKDGNPNYPEIVNQHATPAGNFEGKEVRFGVIDSTIWAIATTAASNGSVNSMHDSYMPLAGLAPMIMMQLGEVIFGGVGSGLYGMIAFVIVTVFVAGLMVGRTPEYLGKKIGSFEMKMVSIVVLIPCALPLIGTALGVVWPGAEGSITNPGAHGLSQVLYAYASMGNNNGSAFAGFGANVPFHNIVGGIAMFISRYWLAIPTLALAGSLAQKRRTPTGPGTLATNTPLFLSFLICVILVVGALTHFPSLALGPIAEHLQLTK